MSSISPDENAFPPIAPLAPVAPLVPAAPEPALQPVAPAPVAVDEPDPALNVPLGTLIFRAGLVAEDQLEDALHEGLQTGKRLGEVLLERQLVSERDLGRLLAGQKGLQFVELESFPVQPEAAAMMSEDKARLYGALPIGLRDGTPIVAVADPSNELVVENVRRALGRTPDFVVVARDDLLRATDRTYGVAIGAAESFAAPQAPPPLLFEPAVDVQPAPPVAPLITPPAPPVEQPPVAQLQETLLVQPAAPAPEPPAALPVEQPFTPLVPPPALEHVPVAPAPEPLAAPPVESFLVPAAPVESPVAPLPVAPEAYVAPPPPPAPAFAGPAPVAPLYEEPIPEPAFEPAATAAPEPMPEPPPQPADSAYVVVLRMSDGDRIAVGCFADNAQATAYARDVVRHLGAQGDGAWPLFEGRFLRPNTIVSVDVVAEQTEQWLGSSLRTSWAANLS